MKPLPLLVLGIFFLAGCGSPGQPNGTDTTTSTTDTTIPPSPPVDCCPQGPPREMQLDCTAFYNFYYADGARAAAELPPGYTAADDGPNPITRIVPYLCATITLDNTTVLRDVHWLILPFAVRPPQDLAANYTSMYSFQTATDNPTFAAALAAWKFEVVNATFTWDATAPLSTVTITGSDFDYNLQILGHGAAEGEPLESRLRFQSGAGTWFDAVSQDAGTTFGAVEGILDGSGLATAVSLLPAPIPTESTKSAVRQSMTFGP